MQASKLQYELECVQRPGAEILIDGVKLEVLSFEFDPSNNTTNLVTKIVEEDETTTVEEVNEGEPELETPAASLELPPPVEKSVAEISIGTVTTTFEPIAPWGTNN